MRPSHYSYVQSHAVVQSPTVTTQLTSDHTRLNRLTTAKLVKFTLCETGQIH